MNSTPVFSTANLLSFLEQVLDHSADELKNVREKLFDRLIFIHSSTFNSSKPTPTMDHVDQITNALTRIDRILAQMERREVND